ncbi:MAG: AGE family epimerase/isomerase [Planctomycetota bacterium]
MTKRELAALERQYRSALLEDCIPFWMRHSLDRDFGGYLHQLDRDGSVFDTDKFMWPENREVWTFSMLYNLLERRPEWLDAAALGARYLREHGRDENGDWYFALNREGRPIVAAYNIFSDYFAAMGFAEYGLAAGDEEAMEISRRTFERIQARKADPKGRYNKRLPAAPKMRNLALPMMDVCLGLVLSRIRPESRFDALIESSMREIMSDFLDGSRNIVFENAGPGGEHPDTLLGRQVTPGHGIEAMWFIMRAAERTGDRRTIQRACEVTLSLLEFGWDAEHEGIFYFMDVDGRPHIELQWDMKLWWAHLETLIALLLGYRLTGEEVLLRWFGRVHDYAWKRYPDGEFGEWFGYLNRRGEVNNRCKGNRWKGCFHLPRALFEVASLLGALAEPGTAATL